VRHVSLSELLSRVQPAPSQCVTGLFTSGELTFKICLAPQLRSPADGELPLTYFPNTMATDKSAATAKAVEKQAGDAPASPANKTIVFLHPDLGIGGAERLVIDAAVGLQKRGHKVVIFTSHCDPKHCFDEARDGPSLLLASSTRLAPPYLIRD
jgi:hypothetical protein